VDRAAERTAPAVEMEVGPVASLQVVIEIVGRELLAIEGVEARAVELVGARLDADVGDPALRLPELGVEGGGLDLKLLDDVGGRHVGGDYLVAIGRGRGRRAVEGYVAEVAARSTHGEADDVGRLKGTIQTGIAGECHAAG